MNCSLAGMASLAVAPALSLTSCTAGKKEEKCAGPEIKISFQEGIPPGESLNEKLDSSPVGSDWPEGYRRYRMR